jgi:hypothetical protein
MKHKKSQLSLFIIVGLIVLFAIFFILYARITAVRNQVTQPLSNEILAKQAAETIQTHVQNCLESVSTNAIIVMGQRGFYLTDAITYNLSFDPELPITVLFDKDISRLPSKQQIAEKITFFITNDNVGVPHCINKEYISKIAPGATFGALTASAEVQQQKIVITLHYPISFKMGTQSMALEEYSYLAPVRLGIIHDKLSAMFGIFTLYKDDMRRDYASRLAYETGKNGNYVAYCAEFLIDRNFALAFGATPSIQPDTPAQDISTTLVWTLKDTFGNKPYYVFFATRHKNNMA